eukprot:403332169
MTLRKNRKYEEDEEEEVKGSRTQSKSTNQEDDIYLENILDIPKKSMPDFQELINLQRNNSGKYFLSKKRQEIDNLSAKYPCICMIGVTGHGKSSTGNTLTGIKDIFRVSCSSKSETFVCQGVVTNWFGNTKESQLIALDTPGLGDSEGRDTKHIANMVKSLKSIGYVNTFLIIINSQEPRFNEMLKQSIRLFEQMFGNEFFKNILICFTKFQYDQRTLNQRRKGKSSSEDQIKSEFVSRFQKDFKHTLESNQFVFIDNMVFADEEEDYEELEERKFKEAKNHIKNMTLNNPVFYCQDIKEAQKENDRIKQEMEEQKQKHEEEKSQILLESQKILKQEQDLNQKKQQQLQDTLNQEKLRFEKEKKEQAERDRIEKQQLKDEKEKLLKEERERSEREKLQLREELKYEQQKQQRLLEEQRSFSQYSMNSGYQQQSYRPQPDLSNLLDSLFMGSENSFSYNKPNLYQRQEPYYSQGSTNISQISNNKKAEMCREYQQLDKRVQKQADASFTQDGKVDHRVHRVFGMNVDGTVDRRTREYRDQHNR